MTKQLSFYANEQETQDFLLIKQLLMRKTDSDTLRTMIKICKKILHNNTAIVISEKSEFFATSSSKENQPLK